MASKQNKSQVVNHGDKITNVVFEVEGKLLATLAVTERVVELKRGRKVIGTEVEKFDNPQFVLADFREDKPKHGIRGIRGSILGADATADASILGDVAVILEGERIPLVLVPGLTASEGAKKRNPKLDTGKENVLVAFRGIEYRVTFGVSQTGPNKRFFWGSVKPMSERKPRQTETSDEDLMDLADLAL